MDSLGTSSNTRSKAAEMNPESNVPTKTSAGISQDAAADPFSLSQYKRSDLDKKALRADYPKGRPRELKKYYKRQNSLIEAYLGSADEEAAEDLDKGLHTRGLSYDIGYILSPHS
jgi:hypothetical protein